MASAASSASKKARLYWEPVTPLPRSCTAADIASVEQLFDITLPAEYKQLVLSYQGSQPSRPVYHAVHPETEEGVTGLMGPLFHYVAEVDDGLYVAHTANRFWLDGSDVSGSSSTAAASGSRQAKNTNAGSASSAPNTMSEAKQKPVDWFAFAKDHLDRVLALDLVGGTVLMFDPRKGKGDVYFVADSLAEFLDSLEEADDALMYAEDRGNGDGASDRVSDDSVQGDDDADEDMTAALAMSVGRAPDWYACDACASLIPSEAKRFSCDICANVDLCESCYMSGVTLKDSPGHVPTHSFSERNHSQTAAAASSSAAAVSAQPAGARGHATLSMSMNVSSTHITSGKDDSSDGTDHSIAGSTQTGSASRKRAASPPLPLGSSNPGSATAAASSKGAGGDQTGITEAKSKRSRKGQ